MYLKKGHGIYIMRKTLKVVLLVAILVLCCATTVCATTNDELIAYATKKFNINGTEVGLSAENARKVERYLKTYPVSSEEAGQIIDKIDAGVNLMRAENVTDPAKLPEGKRSELLSLAQQAAKIAGAELTYNSSDKAVTIYKDGEIFDQATTSSALVQTGNDNTYVVVAGASLVIIAVIGLAVYTVKRSRA